MNPHYPTEKDVWSPLQARDKSLTICFVALKDGSIAEMTETQFDQIMGGETIGGVSKGDFKERPINTYVRLLPDRSSL